MVGTNIWIQGTTSDIPENMQSWDTKFRTSSDEPVARRVRSGLNFSSNCCYINTSGTTGLPKAAIINHARMFKGGLLMFLGDLCEKDIIYTTLPLYHSAAGIIGLNGTILAGATMVLREKFSAGQFWEDCMRHNVTVIQYIGELCRYLVAQPQNPSDNKHKVRLAFGNGLRKDVWKVFESRFQIPNILEFYAATEGNAGFINVNQKFGAVGRNSPFMQKLYPTSFVKFDSVKEEPSRNSKGFCMHAKQGEKALLLVEIKKDFEFQGYAGSQTQTNAKIVKDVFKKGDLYFNSGDLFTFDKDYFVYFADRTGDTFRWKGENVSTIEVSNVISLVDWIEDANVYGVHIPGQDGRAGMVSLTLKSNSNTRTLTSSHCQELFEHCAERLPKYAVPLFIRVQKEMEITSTFKQKKVELVKDGFDPSRIADALYYQDVTHKTFIPLDKALYTKILTGSSRL